MENELYKQYNYNSNIPFLFSTYIREYDIEKANINILFQEGVIDTDLYQYLLIAPREERQIQIGLLIKRNPEISDILKNGIVNAKHELFLSNHIETKDILSIKNDAVFLINKSLSNTRFKNIHFACKNTYTSFMRVFNLEFYYKLDRVLQKEVLDIKGLGKNNLKIHEEYMTDFLLYFFNIIETENIENVITNFINFYNSYINLELPIGYYRNYNSQSKFSILHSDFLLEDIEDTDRNKRQLNISHNMNFLRQIYQYITTIYFNKNKGK